MAKKAWRSAESWTYVLLADRELPPEQQTRFTLSPLSQLERAAVRDEIARVQTLQDGTKSIISHSRRQGLEIAVRHIASIENFPGDTPEKEKWPAGETERRKYLEMLGDDSVQEIGNEIWTKSELGDDLKNS